MSSMQTTCLPEFEKRGAFQTKSSPLAPRHENKILLTLFRLILLLVLSLYQEVIFSQVHLADLQIEGETGILIPQLSTTTRESMIQPVDGLLVYDSSYHQFYYYNGAREDWEAISIEGSGSDGSFTPLGVNWVLGGNSLKKFPLNDPKPILGTLDSFPVIFISDNEERLRITPNGKVKVLTDLELEKSAMVNEDLNVAGNVVLNQETGMTEIKGPTIIGGDSMNEATFTGSVNMQKNLVVSGTTHFMDTVEVQAMKPVYLTGTLEVDQNTRLKDTVTVENMKPVFLTGDLEVDQNTRLKDTMTVENMKPVFLTGDLEVDQNTRLKDTVTVENMKPVFLSGSLNVGKATRLDDSLQVRSLKPTGLTGTLTVGKTATLQDSLLVKNMKPAILSGNLHVSKDAILGSNLSVQNNISTTNGDITAGDDLIATDDMMVGDDLRVSGNTNLNGVVYAGAGTAPYTNVGLLVRGDNTYSFRNELSDGTFLFYIRNDGQGFFSHQNGGSQSTTGSYALLLENPDQGMFIRINDSDPGPENNFIIFTQLTSTGGTIVSGRIESNGSGGVTYGSGGADYAEYLLREPSLPPFEYGDVVGVNNGIVSRNTNAAQRILVVTKQPVVLGNMPERGEEQNYEKVGFMGQLPVKVWGKVAAGDYILASGKNDGTGIARSSLALQKEDYSQIVGIAWESSEKEGLKHINTAIGLNQNDLINEIMDQQSEIDALKDQQSLLQNQMKDLTEKISRLLENN